MIEEKKKEALTLSLDEAATLLGVSRYSVYTQVRLGKISYIRVGKAYRIPRARLIAMIEDGENHGSRSI